MNVDNINHFGLHLSIGIEVFFVYQYAKYWLQRLSILKEEGGEISMHSQKDLNHAAMSGNFKQGYGTIFSNMAVSAKILSSYKTKNPKIAVLAKGIRRTLFLAVLTPIVVAFVLIFITALMQ